MEFDSQIKDVDQDEINNELINKHLELIPYPQPLDFLSKPENTMFTNIFYVIKLNSKLIEIEKLKQSIIKSLNNHKGLLSTFIIKKEEKILYNNGIYLNYEPNNSINIVQIKIKEDINKIELEQLFQENLAVFEHFNSPQINIKIFYNNLNIYLFIDICHTVFDGASIGIFFNSINNAYLDKELPKDYFLYYLYKYNKETKESNKYKEDLSYYNTYFIHDKDLYPKYNNSIDKKYFIISKSLTWEDFRLNLTKYFSIPNSDKITNYNIFLLMNIILANYLYSNMEESHQELNFTFSGRNWKREKYSVGCLSTDYPIYYNFDSKGKLNMKNFYSLMKKQLELKNTISRYPFFHSDKGRLPVIIQREEEFLNINNFCGDDNAEIVYDFTKKFNNKCNIFWSPLSVVLTIGDNLAKYDIMADGSKYNEENINKYIELIERTGKFIFNNMNKIDSDDIINIKI